MATERKYLSLEKLGLYDEKIKKVITDGDAATLKAAKDYADGLAENYDAAGSAASAEAAAKAHAEAQVAAEKQRAEAKEQANATAAATAQAAAEAAQAAADKAQGEVDALETLVGTLPAEATATDVVGYVIERTSGIATDAALSELTGKVTQAEKDIDAIEADYLKAADKTELESKITAEAEAARAAEKANADAIKAIQEDYLVEADKTELSDAIALKAAQSDFEALKEDVDAFFKDADMTESAKDTLKELQEYMAADETGAAAMAASIKQNADDIDALEGRMDAAEAAIETKAASADLEAAVGRIATLEGEAPKHALKSDVEAAIAELEGADAEMAGKITALENKFGEGEGSVEDMIADAEAAAVAEAVSQAEAKDVTRLAEAKKYTDDTIAGLDLANTYAAKTHGHEMAEVNGLVDALAGKQAVGDYATKAEAQAMADGKDAAIAEAKKAGTDASAALEAYKTTNDKAVADNAAAIAQFIEISEAEVLALFQ